VHCAGLRLDDEEDHVADRSKYAQNLDAEEVAGIQRVPVALQELLPSSLAFALRRRFYSGLSQHVRDGRATDLDLQSA